MSDSLIQPSPQHTHANANVAALAPVYARWHETKGGNVDEIIDLFADDVEMSSVLTPEAVPNELAGTHLTKARARDYFDELTRTWRMISYTVDRYIADGDDVVMVGRCHWAHRETGAEVNTPKVDIWRFEGGKAVAFCEMFDSLQFAKAVGVI